MGRQIVGIVVGFVVWSVLWVGGNSLLIAAMPELIDEQGIPKSGGFYALLLLLSGIYSVLSGFLAARIGRRVRAALLCGVLLLVVGIGVQASYWQVMPVWYHAIFLVLILPLNLAGGRLPSAAPTGS